MTSIRGTRLILIVAAAVLACAGQAGARPPKSIDERAEELVNQAHLDTWDRHPGCMPGATHRPSPRWVDGDADPRLVAQLAVLRRPQTPEERERSQHPPTPWPLVPAELFAGATRIAVAHDGTRLLVRIGATDQHAFDMAPSYERCMAWRRNRLRRALREKTQKLRRSALRLDTEWARLARPRPMPPTTITVVPDGSSEKPFGYPMRHEWFARDGLFSLALSRRWFGLVPDGVATVEARFPAKRGHVSVRMPVKDNVVATTLPRRADQLFADRIAWHGPDDTLLRVIRPETWFADFER